MALGPGGALGVLSADADNAEVELRAHHHHRPAAFSAGSRGVHRGNVDGAALIRSVPCGQHPRPTHPVSRVRLQLWRTCSVLRVKVCPVAVAARRARACRRRGERAAAWACSQSAPSKMSLQQGADGEGHAPRCGPGGRIVRPAAARAR
eukprot:scaffold645_cov417-Prasinococcus_capsulatus_cf.AAC.1